MNPRLQVPSILLGLFLRKLEINDAKNLTESLPWRLPEFDGQTAFNTGIPQNAPPDVPRVRFTSRDGRLSLELAPAKLQFRMVPGEITKNDNGQFNLTLKSFAESMDLFVPMATRIHTVFSEHYGLTANRIGVLTEFIGVVGQSASQRMHQVFFGGNPYFGERIQELQINALSRTGLDGTDRQVNQWLRVSTVRGDAQGPVADPAMQIQVDLNTLPEDTYDISAAEFEKFLGGLRNHITNKIELLKNEELFKAS